MLGGKNKQPLGYTIVEVMIVLAVSGVMFVIAASFISGKQQKTAFTAGVNEMASQIQNVIEQVNDGRYSDVPLNCQLSGTSISFPTGSSVQGTNQDCVFRGKIIHFYGNPMTSYELISLADSRTDAGPETTYAGASVKGIPSLTIQTNVPQALTIAGFKTDGTTNTHDNVAILQSLGISSGGSLQSGAQNVELANSTYLTATSAVGSETSVTGGSAMPLIRSATICLSDGTRYATIDVGASDNNQLVVNTQMGLSSCP